MLSVLLGALADLHIDTHAVVARCRAANAPLTEHGWPTYAFWDAAAIVSAEPGVGVRVAERVRPQDFGLLGHLVANSATLGDALLHGLRVSRLSRARTRIGVYADGEHTTVVLGPARPTPHSDEVDFIVTSSVLAARALIERDFAPVEVSFAHDRPRDASHHGRALRAPLCFGATQTSCTLPTQLLLSPLPQGNGHLRSSLEDKAEQRLAGYSGELSHQVRAAIVAEIFSGDPSLERVAARFGTSARTLSRRLEALGIGYREILADTRFELAEQHLQHASMPLAGIAEALGYSHKSAFIRAFKRRAGCGPFEYQERLRKQRSE